MQTAIVVIILTVATGYAAQRFYKALTAPPDPCASCSGCELKKKVIENFVNPKKSSNFASAKTKWCLG